MRESKNTTDAGSDGRPKRRSRNGCRTCRSRKVKCDERPGGCNNCLRLDLHCPNSPAHHHALDQGEPEGDYLSTQAGIRRSRTYRSCKNCRTSKSRCSGDRPVCLRCRQRDFECMYDGKQAPAWLEAATRETESRKSMQRETPPSTVSIYSTSTSPSLSSLPSPSLGDSTKASQERPRTSESSFTASNWLLAQELPRDRDGLIELIQAFFANIHPLRCYGFIHKQSFLERIDGRDWLDAWRQAHSDALLLAICALGAKFCVLSLCNELQLADGLALSAGSQWAQKAQELVLLALSKASIETTMAVVLLHEHEVRVGHSANACMLAGLAVRLAQALQIDVDSSHDAQIFEGKGLSFVTQESRRRLFWSIYTMDSWVGGGIDELTLLDEAAIEIQLPCSDLSFELGRPCIVEALSPGVYLSSISAEDRATGNVESPDIQGHFVRLVSLRRKVLRFVRGWDQIQISWLAESEFFVLQAQLHQWLANLPESLHVARAATSQKSRAPQLGAILLLHLTYHQTMSDLMRIGMSELSAGHIRQSLEQTAFLKTAEDQCFEHNMALCALFVGAASHGLEALTDTWLSIVAHGSARIVIDYFSMGLGSSREKGEAVRKHAMAAVHSNIRALERMIPIHAPAQSLYTATINLLSKADTMALSANTDQLAPSDILENQERPAINPDISAQYVSDSLPNSLSNFWMARTDMPDNKTHTPGRASLTSMSSYQDLSYRATGNACKSGPDFPDHREIEQAAPFDLATNPAPIPYPASFTTLIEDPLTTLDYRADGSQAYFVTSGLEFPAQQWIPGTTSRPTGSGNSSHYLDSQAGGPVEIPGPVPRTLFDMPSIFPEDRSAGQALTWSV